MKGYQIRNRPTMVEQINARPRRRTFNDFIRDAEALSGKRDVTQEDAEVQAMFADDPTNNPLPAEFWLGKSEADTYAAAECAEGRWREDHPNDPTET